MRLYSLALLIYFFKKKVSSDGGLNISMLLVGEKFMSDLDKGISQTEILVLFKYFTIWLRDQI